MMDEALSQTQQLTLSHLTELGRVPAQPVPVGTAAKHLPLRSLTIGARTSGLCRGTWDVTIALPLEQVEAVRPQRLHNTNGSLSHSRVTTYSLHKEHMLPSTAVRARHDLKGQNAWAADPSPQPATEAWSATDEGMTRGQRRGGTVVDQSVLMSNALWE